VIRRPQIDLLIALLAAVMFLSFLGTREFAASHEARVAQVAREMAESGWPWNPSQIEVPAVHLVNKQGVKRLAPNEDAPPVRVNPWIVPVLNGQIRLQKPPLPYWGTAIVYRIAGVSEAASRLVPALLGILATFLLLDLATILYGRSVAVATTLIFLTTFLVVDQYRLAMADPYLAFFTISAVWAWVKASDRTPTRSNTWFIVLFYVSLALGALAKGPLIFLHVLIPVVLYHLCFRRRIPRGLQAHAPGLVLFALIALPWPLAVMHQVSNAIELWKYESVGEVSGENLENVREWWYYIVNLPLQSAPWVPLWVFSIIFILVRNRSRYFFPLLWYIAMVGFFSIAGQKKLPYLLPMLPAQAMMLGVATIPLIHLARRARMRGVFGAVVLIQTLLALVWLGALPFLVHLVNVLGAASIVIFALAAIAVVYSAVQMFTVRPSRWFLGQAVAWVLILTSFGAYYLTPLNNQRSPAAVVRELQSRADGTRVAILQSRVPEEASFYLPLHPKTGPAPIIYLALIDDHMEVERRARSKKPTSIPPPDEALFQSWLPNANVMSVRRLDLESAPGDARWKAYEILVRHTGYATAR
jgi:4-amino-4-deoxy-L-arabinose transferase-like glycosyltransferase